MTIKDLAEMTLNYGLMCQKYVPPAVPRPSSFHAIDFRLVAHCFASISCC